MKKKMTLRITALLLVVLLGLSAITGCGSSESSAINKDAVSGGYAGNRVSMAAAEEAAVDMAAGDYEMDAPAEAEAAAGGAQGNTSTVEIGGISQKLIKTVELSVKTSAFDELFSGVKTQVEQLGGYIESSSVSSNSYSAYNGDTRYASMTIRIPSDRLDGFVAHIKEQANVTGITERCEDVTLEYSDTEAHVRSLRTEQETLNRLLEQAQDLETIIALQNELTNVRYEIESYESRLKYLANKVDYSTVYLTIDEIGEATVITEDSWFTKVRKNFVRSLRDVGELIADIGLFLLGDLPKLLFMALVIFIIVVIIKKLRKNRGAGRPKRKLFGRRKKDAALQETLSARPAEPEPAKDAEE